MYTIRFYATIAIEVNGNYLLKDTDPMCQLSDQKLEQRIKDDIRIRVSEQLGQPLCDYVSVTLDKVEKTAGKDGMFIRYESHAIQHISGNKGD